MYKIYSPHGENLEQKWLGPYPFNTNVTRKKKDKYIRL